MKKAGDGNRTRVTGLEGRGITTMLLPQIKREPGRGERT